MLKELECLINNTKYGSYNYDFTKSIDGRLYYIELKIYKHNNFSQVVEFLKDFNKWRLSHSIQDYQIKINTVDVLESE